MPARGQLCRPHPQGPEAGRSAGAGADEIRVDDQPQDRQGARPRSAADAARPRRRGNRMTAKMKRREFITLLGSAAAWPLGARAQQPGKLRTIGLLAPGTVSSHGPWFAELVRRLHELGWIESRNISFEYRWGEGRPERYDEIAAELVRSKVDIIVTTAPVLPAVQRATSVIPIVFALSGDPVGAGLIASLARPGGNATGLSMLASETAGKRLELLREVVPGVRRLAVMVNLGFPEGVQEGNEAQAAARALGLEVVRLEIRRASDIASSFESLD